MNNILGSGVKIIAEVAQTHDGSIETAHAFIDAISGTGADAVKFQTHIAMAESSMLEPWRVKFSTKDASRYDYWKRMEFTRDQWDELSRHAHNKGLLFLSSPFSVKAAELLKSLGMGAWKIPSGEIHDPFLMRYVCNTALPIILSTGLCTIDELDRVVAEIRQHGNPVAVMQCTTAYPCPPEMVGINMVSFFRDRYQCPVGLSDHSGTIFPALSAVTLGAQLIEVHVTLDRNMLGPDVSSSVTIDELKMLVQGIRFIETMQTHPMNKKVLDANASELRKIFSKSLFAARDLPAGHQIEDQDIVLKKPGTGLSPALVSSILGRKTLRKITCGTMLSKNDIEER